jgi:hypothetical protein
MPNISSTTNEILPPRAKTPIINEDELQRFQILQTSIMTIDAQELKRAEIDFNRHVSIFKKNLDLMAQQDRWIA